MSQFRVLIGRSLRPCRCQFNRHDSFNRSSEPLSRCWCCRCCSVVSRSVDVPQLTRSLSMRPYFSIARFEFWEREMSLSTMLAQWNRSLSLYFRSVRSTPTSSSSILVLDLVGVVVWLTIWVVHFDWVLSFILSTKWRIAVAKRRRKIMICLFRQAMKIQLSRGKYYLFAVNCSAQRKLLSFCVSRSKRCKDVTNFTRNVVHK